MIFLQQWILFLLPLVIVPAILYMLRHRWSDRQPWAATAILMQAYQQTASKQKQSDFIHLFLQMALIALCVVLVAQPVYTIYYRDDVDEPVTKPAELHSVYLITDGDAANAPAYFKSGFEQLDAKPQFDAASVSTSNPTAAEKTDILILHGVVNVSQWLANVVKLRVKAHRPVWIFAPHCLDEPSRERLKDFLPPLAQEPSKTARPYETPNPDSPFWQSSAFDAVVGKPVPFPSLVNSVYQSTSGWRHAFLNSDAVLYRGDIFVFSSAVDGTHSAWSMSDLWVPLLDRAAVLSLNPPAMPRKCCVVHSKPGEPWLSKTMAWLGLAVLAVLFCLYRRKSSRYSRWERGLGWACFLAAGAVLVIMALQVKFAPRVWVKPALLFLVDDSQSMNLPQTENEVQTRREAMIQWLEENEEALERLSKSYRLFEGSFSSPESVREISTVSGWTQALKQRSAYGERSDPADAVAKGIKALSTQIDSQALSAVLVFSDGAPVGKTEPDAIQNLLNLRNDGTQPRVYALALGQNKPIPNAALEDVKLDSVLFAGHENELEFQVHAESLQGKEIAVELTQTLLDSTGKPESDAPAQAAASQIIKITNQNFTANGTLKFIPPKTGRYEYKLKIVNRDDDFIQLDNAVVRQAEALERRIKVLLTSNSPNWEFRYLRNLLARSGMIDLSVVLQDASKEYVNEDSCAIETFPNSVDALNQYDALIFINPSLDWFSSDQKEALRGYFQVRRQEANQSKSAQKAIIGFWNAKTDFAPIAALYPKWLPFDVSAVSAQPGDAMNTVTTSPTGQTFAWLELSFARLNPIGAMVEVSRLKPNVRTLLTTWTNSANVKPVLTVHNAEKARVATIMTDSLWQWRKGNGEETYNRFQLSLVRAMVKPEFVNRLEKQINQTPVPEEWRSTSSDFNVLTEICQPAGGFVFRPADNKSVLETVRPDVPRISVVRPPVDLWSQPWLLAALLAILFFDWARFYLIKG